MQHTKHTAHKAVSNRASATQELLQGQVYDMGVGWDVQGRLVELVFFLYGVLSCWFLGFWFGFFIVEGVVLFFWVCFFLVE